MKYKSLFLIVFLVLGCTQKPGIEDLNNLNGYWEISKVVFPDRTSKEYNISTTIDFFYYEDSEGYRKKVQPRLDGTFSTSNDAENFKVEMKNDNFTISYQNQLSSWEEKILKINKEQLVLVNDEGIEYHYKKFHSISGN